MNLPGGWVALEKYLCNMENHEEQIFDFFLKGDWQSALKWHQMTPSPKVLWPVPTVDDLLFIGDACDSLGVSRVTSVGSGRGFLEWLLTRVTGLNLTCLELDELFWKKIGAPPFSHLLFKRSTQGVTSDEFTSAIKSSAKGALLFCYFNDSNEFINYLGDFTGPCLIILGSESPLRLTNPSPFPDYLPKEWTLFRTKNLEQSKGDVIAIYYR